MMDRIALEVTATWEGHVMGLDLLLPGKQSYVVGGNGRCSFPVDSEVLGGADTWILIDEAGVVRLPESARMARIQGPSGVLRTPDGEVRLALDERLAFTLGTVRFDIHALPAPVKPDLPLEFDLGAFAWAASGVALFATTLLLLWYVPTPGGPHGGFRGFMDRLISGSPSTGPSLTPSGWVGDPAPAAADPCAAPARRASARGEAPAGPAMGLGSAMGSGFGSIPITGGRGGSTTVVPADAVWVTDAELVSIFGYPVCMQR